MDVQLPSPRLNTLTFQEQPGLRGTAHARRVGRKNKRVDGRLNITLPWRENERTRRIPRLSSLCTAALAAPGRHRLLPSDWLLFRTRGGLLCEPRMRWPDRGQRAGKWCQGTSDWVRTSGSRRLVRLGVINPCFGLGSALLFQRGCVSVRQQSLSQPTDGQYCFSPSVGCFSQRRARISKDFSSSIAPRVENVYREYYIFFGFRSGI